MEVLIKRGETDGTINGCPVLGGHSGQQPPIPGTGSLVTARTPADASEDFRHENQFAESQNPFGGGAQVQTARLRPSIVAFHGIQFVENFYIIAQNRRLGTLGLEVQSYGGRFQL